jgi:hypothetical protein
MLYINYSIKKVYQFFPTDCMYVFPVILKIR